MSKKSDSVIIVKKSSGKKHDHHGGSWKIAYADFMTAMMAFFLVMWLLSSSSPEQRQQIAEYFKMPIKASLAQGNKNSLSDSVIPGGGDDMLKKEGEIFKQTLKKIDAQKSQMNLKSARQKLEDLIKIDPRLNNFKSNLRLSLTDAGLLIQITDSQDRPMFKIGGKTPEPYMVSILQALVPVLNDLPNRINITGHTDSLPYANGEVGYSNWELSSDRANTARRILVNDGLASNKFMRVVGTADTMSQNNSQPDDPINRRISILVLSHEKEKQILQEDVLLPDTPASQSNGKTSSSIKIASPGEAALKIAELPANLIQEKK
ncbi:flagellar motor protein MotB [Enterobacter pasteurii]|uniref:flagellar motor protein MotB n=1 Tax=Enterobacter pasteurii TaxID=3029761 RepID=UPI0011DE4F59|nr:flagellar motor protein MotB [Enterobacter pasteurii]QLA68102.1 flagellar motor protein MotB [Enterobacter pasteurii]